MALIRMSDGEELNLKCSPNFIIIATNVLFLSQTLGEKYSLRSYW